VLGPLLGRDGLGTWHRVDTAEGPAGLRRLLPERAGQEHARLLFAEEARRIATLSHPALLRVRAHDARAPVPWILTDPIDGPSLEAVRVPAPQEAALALLAHLADGLAALHARKQVHVLPFPSHVLRVGNAWCWRTFRDVRARDEVRALKGRHFPEPRRAPPELAAAHPEPVASVPYAAWGLGVVLRHLSGAGPPRDEGGALLTLPEGLSEGIRDRLAALLAEAPARRPASFEALARLISPRPPTTAPPSRSAPVPRPRGRRA
jgi:hypothetical protein